MSIIVQDPSVFKFIQLHVDIFRHFFIYFEIYSMDMSKMISHSLGVLKIQLVVFKLDQFIRKYIILYN